VIRLDAPMILCIILTAIVLVATTLPGQADTLQLMDVDWDAGLSAYR